MANTGEVIPVSYKAGDMNENLDREVERLRTQALWGWAKESRNLLAFGLRDGISILEVGSGPGFVTEQLLNLCPHSHITCVEIDPDLAPRAERYLQSRDLGGRYKVVEGDLMAMDFPDGSFDFAVARLVFQHLRDPRGALAEIRRVLKPGGRLVIHDIDIGLGEIVDPPTPDTEAIEQRLHEAQGLRGGNPRIGRRLWKLMEAAGYEELDLEAVPIHTDATKVEAIFPSEWDPGGYKYVLDLGVITPNDLQILHRAHTAFQASPEKYALFISLMFHGQKPLGDQPAL